MFMRIVIFSLIILLLGSFHLLKEAPKEVAQQEMEIYDFKVTDLKGEIFDFATLKGKKIMIVNTASKCGLTPQYKGLQKLYETYQNKNFVIVGFPSNDFLFQEPGTSQEIASFCKTNYGVSFPMMEKIKVRGRKKHPIYEYLTEEEKNGWKSSKVKWNFQKYLISTSGKLEKICTPSTKPDSPEIIAWIEE
jgi:glutathione peroxidase